jgi:hypothetical protein
MTPEPVALESEEDDDDGHGPWFDVGGAILCSCRYPVDKDERCTRPRTPEAIRDALLGALFDAADGLLDRLDHGFVTVDADDSYVYDLRAARDELVALAALPVHPEETP